MTIWAGRLLVALSLLHLVVSGTASTGYLDDWLSGELWEAGELTRLTPAEGAFWFAPGSFAIPMLLLGALVAGLGRAGRTPPAYLGWGLGAWALVCAAATEPSGFPLALVPAAMLVVAARRRGGRRPPGPAHPDR